MELASGTDRPDIAMSREAAPGTLRARVLWGLGTFFALAMGLVTVLIVSADAREAGMPLILRLGLLTLVLPSAMAAVARSILGPAAAMDSQTEQLRGLYSQARLDALLDPITGLGNHRAFQEELHRQIEDAARHDHPLALVILDLDGLKRVNDELGHAGGDQLLGSMGRLLGGASRAADRAFRVGGDEFALLLPHADAEAAVAVMRRVLASAVSGENTFGRAFSFSAGVSAYPRPSSHGRDLLRHADAALYWAKRHGRTDIQMFEPERHRDADDGRTPAELAEAIEHVRASHSLTAVYQPIFDLTTGEPTGFEGLVRPTEDAGFRDASALFTAAEIAGRTVELDMFAIETIVTGLEERPIDGYLSVNLSPRSLETALFRVTDLVAILAERELEPSRVVLELTEREAVEDIDRLRENLSACRAAGFRIAADDVGAGNAGLRLLSEIEFDVVKIDLSLVQGGVLRDSALSVLRAILDVAARQSATVVAEGIETVEQLDAVRKLGIATGQGYLLAAPTALAAADGLDLASLVQSHEARRQALLGALDAPSTWARRSAG
ncbi:MAG TPA: bifunctional diguanylate cyclase/phosphodiesterase [Candidatus Limnocylindria bacterium]